MCAPDLKAIELAGGFDVPSVLSWRPPYLIINTCGMWRVAMIDEPGANDIQVPEPQKEFDKTYLL
jgi:hypothetical protein